MALLGLLVGVGIYQHVAAKYVFVRMLRDSPHLQSNTVTHWAIWLGTNAVLGALGFLVAEAVGHHQCSMTVILAHNDGRSRSSIIC